MWTPSGCVGECKLHGWWEEWVGKTCKLPTPHALQLQPHTDTGHQCHRRWRQQQWWLDPSPLPVVVTMVSQCLAHYKWQRQCHCHHHGKPAPSLQFHYPITLQNVWCTSIDVHTAFTRFQGGWTEYAPADTNGTTGFVGHCGIYELVHGCRRTASTCGIPMPHQQDRLKPQGSLVTPGGHSIVLWGALSSFIYLFTFHFIILALDSIIY
jgi:hypothetical protein